MNVKVIPTVPFKRNVKPLLKKFPSLKVELKELEKELQLNPKLGVPIGKNAYKIRLSVKSKGRGKSGGLRVVTFLVVKVIENVTNVYLLAIFDKSEYENIQDRKILDRINAVLESEQ
jgi:hypothetical protein